MPETNDDSYHARAQAILAEKGGYDFSWRARGACDSAQTVARGLRHEYIASEHLLLGLMSLSVKGGLARAVLDHFGIGLDAVTQAIEARAVPGRKLWFSSMPEDVPLPVTGEGKEVLARAIVIAHEYGHPRVESGHMLIALLEAESGIASRALLALGLTPAATRESFLTLYGQAHGPDRLPGQPSEDD